MTQNGWALLDFGGLTAKGSQQYLDTDDAYAYDSGVSNASALSEGDYCLVARRTSRGGSPVPHFVTMIANVECLDTGSPYNKIVQVCPECGVSSVKPRTSAEHRNSSWRCQKCKSEFPTPAMRTSSVRRYRAIYSDYRVDVLSGQYHVSVDDLARAEIRSATATSRPQLSIRRIDITKLIPLPTLDNLFGQRHNLESPLPRLQPSVAVIGIENRQPGQRSISEASTPYNAQESTLVQEFSQWLQSQGIITAEAERVRIPSEGSQYFYADLWIPATREIVEAKVGKFARHAIRMGIGQVLDYCHLFNLHREPSDCYHPALLLDEAPPMELRALILQLGISIYVRDKEGFSCIRPQAS